MNDSILFLPELLLVASILAIPALYLATENKRSYSICANASLSVSLGKYLQFRARKDGLGLREPEC